MQVHLLHLDGCPHRQPARDRLALALAACGHPDAAVREVVVSDPVTASRDGFAGSPTITVDGVDLFAAAPGDAGWACRLYRTPDGLAGVPALEDLVAALKERMGS